MRTTSIAAGLVAVFGPAVATLAQCPIERLLPPAEQDYGDFGMHVAMYGDRVLVADHAAATLCPIVFDCATGAVYDFRLIDGRWERVQRILPPDVQQGDRFGSSMDLDGDRLIVGAGFADLAAPDTGGAYVYDFDGTQWVETGRIPPPRPIFGNQFGRRVIIDRDIALVQQGGSLFVFNEETSGQWVLHDELRTPDGEGGYFGGHSNVLTNDWLFVGTPFDDSIATSGGSVYVFRREGPAEFVFHEKIDAPRAEEGPRFGTALAFEAGQLFIGAVNAHRAFEFQGVVYRYEYDGSAWIQRQEIQHRNPASDDNFGDSLAVQDGTLIVGASGADPVPIWSIGAVMVFTRGVDGDWLERLRLRPDLETGPFGVAVDLDGTRMVAGSPSERVGGAPLGGAHVFDLACEICPADLDADGALTIFDFLTYLNLFQDGDAQADFDGDGELTIFDFLAFQDAFQAGCE